MSNQPITSEQINAALLERHAKLTEVSEWGYITITVSGRNDSKPSISIQVSTYNTELTPECSDLDAAIKKELSRHASRDATKSEADRMREHAADLIKRATALEAESLPA